MDQQTDVLICGAGPVGLSLAAQLELMGVSCLIIDKNRHRSEMSKALVVWGRSLELLNTCMDAHAFLQAGRPVRKAKFYQEGASFAEIEFSSQESEFGTGVLIPQSMTEKLLEERLLQLGAAVHRETELVSFEQSEEEVQCLLRDADGEPKNVKAKYLVGCDGAHSAVRHGLGLPFPGKKDGLRWVLADVELSGDLPEADVASFWSRLGILLLFRFDENVWRVVAEEPLVSEDAPRRDPTLEEIQKHLGERGAGNVRASNPTWLAEFRVSERKVENYRAGNVFLAGDAAHVHSPAGGQGMNTGIQDSCNLAWKIAWKLRGAANAALLDSYSQERSQVGAMVVKATSHMTRLATTESQLLQSVRNAVAKIALHFDWVQDKVRKNLAEYTIAYRDSSLNGSDERVGRTILKCGDRVPNIRWTDGTGECQTLYQHLAAARAVLLILNSSHAHPSESSNQEFSRKGFMGQATSDQGRSWLAIELVAVDGFGGQFDDGLSVAKRDAGETEGDLVGVVLRDEIKTLQLGASGWAIIRPDGYLAAAGNCEDLQAASEWLKMFAEM